MRRFNKYIIRLFRRSNYLWPVMIELDRTHWGHGVGTLHGPREEEFAWWRPIVFAFYDLNTPFGVKPPSLGYRLWVYTARGALLADLHIDRRPKV